MAAFNAAPRRARIGSAGGYRVSVSDPRQVLGRASAKYREAEQHFDQARQAAVDAVVAALRAGVPPTEVVELSPFSPSHVRVLAREHGIPPAKGGPPKKTAGR
ncbi:MAG TPA: hypothetical protein VJY85_09780 [Candidatus Limnocylindria bacterium]|nr:hypothetical protein [Candidatus Limnocylindria bacterium]